jgi:hypothetical protein
MLEAFWHERGAPSISIRAFGACFFSFLHVRCSIARSRRIRRVFIVASSACAKCGARPSERGQSSVSTEEEVAITSQTKS